MKLYAVTLGCDKNRVDTEKILAEAVKHGAELTDTAEDADIALVNTCAFIDSAKKESIDVILELASYKERGLKYLAVTGCFSERYAADMREMFPEVDAFCGINGAQHIGEILENIEKKPQFSGEKPLPETEDRILTTPPHYAYLKIADGCDNWCSYCAIPRIRGRYRSLPFEQVLKEAENLAERGVSEIIVVAQDTTAYGKDLYGKVRIVELLRAIAELPFDKIRLLYAYPEGVTDELIDFIATSPKAAKYIDMPIQHVSDGILKAMRRRVTSADIKSVIAKIRTANPDIAIRSSFIAGFPNETEEDFRELLEFIKAGNIDYAGFFAYSREEGTLAYKMTGQIPAKIKKRRVTELEKAESAVIAARHDKLVGRTVKVTYEGLDEKKMKFYGRMDGQAPEVDGKVYLSSENLLEVGRTYDVLIEKGGFYPKGKTV